PHAELHVRIHDVGRTGRHHVDDGIDLLAGGDVAARRAAANAAPIDDEAAAVHVRILAERDAVPLLLENPVARRCIARPQAVEVDRQRGLTDKDQGGAGECRTNEKARYPHLTVSPALPVSPLAEPAGCVEKRRCYSADADCATACGSVASPASGGGAGSC